MNGGHRTFVTGIHGLQHVEGLFAAHLADDDAVGAHTEAVTEQLPLADGALPFNIRRTRFQAHDVFLGQPQLGRVFDGDQPLTVRNVLRQNVEEGGFSGACASRDQDADTRLDRGRQHFHHLG